MERQKLQDVKPKLMQDQERRRRNIMISLWFSNSVSNESFLPNKKKKKTETKYHISQ